MAWSTRQLAELAGTTVKAVRYYHKIELLELPRRTSNGYKQYEVSHLVRLLQIKRLSDMGVPLSRVPTMERDEAESYEAISALDADLEARAQRINQVRAELAEILRHRAPAHLPPSFADASADLSQRQRELLMVYSSVLSEKSLATFRELIDDPSPTDREFEALDAEADEATIDDLAARMLPGVVRSRAEQPWSADPAADSPHGVKRAEQTMAEAMAHLYNPAQRRVLKRLNALLTERDPGDAQR